jgi:NhaP-type Na+/H+ or K+/H+ antiporter
VSEMYLACVLATVCAVALTFLLLPALTPLLLLGGALGVIAWMVRWTGFG